MPVLSIYYTARRSTPLTNDERLAIRRVEAAYSVEERRHELERTGRGAYWEDFCIYDPADPTEPDVVFEGATGLPDASEAALAEGLAHWCSALSEIRRALPGCEWRVAIDDHEIPWDEAEQQWDPWEAPPARRGWMARLLGRWLLRH